MPPPRPMAYAVAASAAVAGLFAVGWAAVVAGTAATGGVPEACEGPGEACVAAASGGADDRASLLQMERIRRAQTDEQMADGFGRNESQNFSRTWWPGVPAKRTRNFTDFEERLEVFAEIANVMFKTFPRNRPSSTLGELPREDWPKIRRTKIARAGYEVERCWGEGMYANFTEVFPTFCIFKNCLKKIVIMGIQGFTEVTDFIKGQVYFWDRHFPNHPVYTELVWTFQGSVLNQYTMMITGHSFGGYLAELLAGMFGLPGFAFNSPAPDKRSMLHSGRRFGLQTPRTFHVIKAEWDLFVAIPNTYHSVAPIWLKGAWDHMMPGTLSYLKRVPHFRDITTRNILDYVSLGQRRRRQGHWMTQHSWCDGQPIPRPQPQCVDSDACLRQQPRWPAYSTCAASAKHCEGEWSPDMLHCCPVTCFESGVDVSEVECKLDAWNGQCFNSDTCLKAASNDPRATCAGSSEACDSDDQRLVDMLNCCPRTCEDRAIDKHGLAYAADLMEDAPCKRGTPQSDDDCYRFHVKQRLGEDELYHGIPWKELRCEIHEKWFAEKCNLARQRWEVVSDEFRCCRATCKRMVKKFALPPPHEPPAEGSADVDCPGALHVEGYGTVQLMQTYGDTKYNPDKWLPLAKMIENGTKVVLGQWGRIYFSKFCERTGMKNTYVAVPLLGKKLSYSVKLGSTFDCGCAADMYLTSMAQNKKPGICKDYYCDPAGKCGETCSAFFVMQASARGWLTKLQLAGDSIGRWDGFGGGQFRNVGIFHNGPRAWTKEQWRPGNSTCIDTAEWMHVSAIFRTDHVDDLKWIEVKVSQGDCIVSTGKIAEYNYNPTTGERINGMKTLSAALRRGMTPVLAVWAASDLSGLDGPGQDGLGGGCDYDSQVRRSCGDGVEYSDFAIADLLPWQVSDEFDPADECVQAAP